MMRFCDNKVDTSHQKKGLVGVFLYQTWHIFWKYVKQEYNLSLGPPLTPRWYVCSICFFKEKYSRVHELNELEHVINIPRLTGWTEWKEVRKRRPKIVKSREDADTTASED